MAIEEHLKLVSEMSDLFQSLKKKEEIYEVQESDLLWDSDMSSLNELLLKIQNMAVTPCKEEED